MTILPTAAPSHCRDAKYYMILKSIQPRSGSFSQLLPARFRCSALDVVDCSLIQDSMEFENRGPKKILRTTDEMRTATAARIRLVRCMEVIAGPL